LLSRAHRRALFSTTIAAAMNARAIALDDTSKDFLDNLELHRVLMAVRKATKRNLDILGFDACLMNLLEIAYQLRSTTDYIVGSEQTEPGDGWPYDTILRDLASNPDMAPVELGTRIVKRYVASYSSDAVTQSLLDEAKVEATAKAVDRLAGSLITALKTPAEYAAVVKAINATQSYEFKEFIDLHDLSQALVGRTKNAAVKEAARGVMATIPKALVAAEGHKGTSVKASHGVAIYVPRTGEVSVAYNRLAFAKATRWDGFMTALKGR
jgi:hypothetical protein